VVGFFFGRRETLNEQLVREAGLGPQPERRRPVRGLTYLAKREQAKLLVKNAGERDYLSEQEAARNRKELRLQAPDTPPPGFG
jgi:hypothetical protein